MRRTLSIILLAAFGFASAAHGAAAVGGGIGVNDQFTVSGIKVDATAQSPTTARDLAMKQGRSLAWRELFQRFSNQPPSGPEPQLAERELLAMILRSEASNERRNTTRYVADVTFHFNPTAVRQLLGRSNEGGQFVDIPFRAPTDVSTHLAVNARFDTIEDWATLRARLGAAKAVTGVDVVGRTLDEAQIFLGYSGQVEELQAALALVALELTSSDGQYTLELDPVGMATTSVH